MKKWIYSVWIYSVMVVFVTVMVFAVMASAEGDLKRIPSPYIGAGQPIQQFCPTATAGKALGTKNVYKNFTTTGLTAIKFTGVNTAVSGNLANVRVRIGGFSGAAGGTETDYTVGTNEVIWLGKGVNKVGFSAISSITPGTTVNIQKQ